MTDLDERLARALREAVPEPNRMLDGATIRASATKHPRHRYRLAPALAAAAVLAVVAGVMLTVHHSGPDRGHTDHTGGTDSPQAITLRVVERMLASAPVVPGATRVDHSPTQALDQPLSTAGSPNTIGRTRWWTAPGTPAATLQFVRTHLPAGLTAGGTSRSGGSGPDVQGLFFDATGTQWSRPASYTGLELLVTVTPLGSGVAIRADSEAIWLPQRTADQNIPLTAGSVDVVLDRRGNAPTVRRTLGASAARSLATVVNHLPVATPGITHCAVNRGFTDTLVFHDQRGSVTVRAAVGGCSGVTVTIGGDTRGPALHGGDAVDLAITNELGLPHNYGQ